MKVVCLTTILFVTSYTVAAKKPQAKYVFYMIGDGMGINEVYGAQLYNRATGNGPETLPMTKFPVRTFVTTNSASAIVTDSAAGGTALSTGRKTANDVMGMDASKTEAMSSIAEWAKASGFGTGVATSVGVNHATPAAFYAHTPTRKNYETIAEQLISSQVDFAAGAGFLNEKDKTGHDSEYFEDKARAAGISILRGAELNTAGIHTNRIICFSADPKATKLKFAIDMKPGDTKLVDFTRAGIEYLYANYAKKGFFFMIEGGQIDSAGHNDDAATNSVEVNDFAESVNAVLDFYNQHPDETLIVITADHETGAFVPSSGAHGMGPEILGLQKESENVISDKFKAFAQNRRTPPSWDEVKNFLRENLGFWDKVAVDSKTEASFKETYETAFVRKENTDVVTLYSVNTKIISDAVDYFDKQSGFIYAHGSHSYSPVGLYVKGVGAEEFWNCEDNTDIPKTIAKIAKYRYVNSVINNL